MAKKKKQTVGYRYFANAHMVLCHGPVDALTKISFSEKDAYTAETSSNSTITIDKPSLFGGDDQQGGISGKVELLFGHADQQQSTKLQEICAKISTSFGGVVSAYRSVMSVVLNNLYIGTSPNLPDSKWRVKRIHTRHDGEVQWYDAKAEIGLATFTDIRKIAFVLDDSGSMSADNMSNMKAGVNSILSRLAGKNIDVMIQAINSGVRIYRSASDADMVAAQAFVDSLVASGGTSATAAYGNINPFFNGDYEKGMVVTLSDGEMQNVVEAKLMISEVFESVKFVGLGMGIVGSLNFFDNTGNPVQVVDAEGIQAALNALFYSEADINPAHIIRECLTNPIWGIGIVESNIDDTSFMLAADTLYAEGMGMSIKWTDSTAISEFVDTVKQHINAQLYLDRITNKWKLYLIRDDYDQETLITVDEGVIQDLEFERRTLAECVNTVTVTYYDRERGKESTVPADDIARIAQQGGVIPQHIEYLGFSNSDIASRVAYRELKTLSSTLASVSFNISEALSNDWHIGMPFKLSDSNYGLDEAIMRVTAIKFGNGINNTVYVEAVEDSFSSPAQAVVEYVPPIVSDSAAKDAKAIVFEVPFIELVEQYGQDEINAKLLAENDLGFVGMAAIRPNNLHINASLYSDSGAGFDEESNLDFCPNATLKTEISYIDSTFEVENIAEFELLEVNNRLQLNDELLAFVSFDSATNLLTVKRGCFDTVPQNHAADSVLYGWDNYSGLDSTEYLSGETVNLKALTLTGSDALSLSEATSHSVILGSRAIRPYPPANVQINGEYYPTKRFAGSIEISWAYRNRSQQTGGAPLGFFESDTVAEDGVTYTVVAKSFEGLELFKEENISANIYGLNTLFIASTSCILEIFSVRDGFESYQKFSHILSIQKDGEDFVFDLSEVYIAPNADNVNFTNM